jgi:hypothetical protein
MSVTQAFERLRAMKRSPRGDWTIDDIRFLCRNLDLDCRAPKRGVHYVVSYPKIEGLLTIRSERPLKAFYIMLFVQLVESSMAIE